MAAICFKTSSTGGRSLAPRPTYFQRITPAESITNVDGIANPAPNTPYSPITSAAGSYSMGNAVLTSSAISGALLRSSLLIATTCAPRESSSLCLDASSPS